MGNLLDVEDAIQFANVRLTNRLNGPVRLLRHSGKYGSGPRRGRKSATQVNPARQLFVTM